MSITTTKPPKAAASPIGIMPARMRVLFITTPQRTGGWLAQALAADSASIVQLEESFGGECGLARLCDQLFDAILISHEPGYLDALELIEAVRGGGSNEPILVLGSAEDDELTSQVYEAGGDAYLSVSSTTTRTMLWTLARAIERHSLTRENRRLSGSEKHRLQQEQQETQRLLADQRALIQNTRDVPANLKLQYREMLRSHVIMGSGNLRDEIQRLSNLLAEDRVSSAAALTLHLDVLEELTRGLGNRSARHVLSRANLLVIDLLAQLSEHYRVAAPTMT
jgi:DNA-binding response OmpR family regulator